MSFLLLLAGGEDVAETRYSLKAMCVELLFKGQQLQQNIYLAMIASQLQV